MFNAMDGWKTYLKKAKKVNLIDYISISLHMVVFLEILLYFLPLTLLCVPYESICILSLSFYNHLSTFHSSCKATRVAYTTGSLRRQQHIEGHI